jgi:hypothetical protein
MAKVVVKQMKTIIKRDDDTVIGCRDKTVEFGTNLAVDSMNLNKCSEKITDLFCLYDAIMSGN